MQLSKKLVRLILVLLTATVLNACRTMDDTIEIPEPLPGPNQVQQPQRYRLLTPLAHTPPNAKPADLPRHPIPYTSRPPTIDGMLNEPLWKQQAPQDVNIVYGGKQHGRRNPKPPADVRFAWDENYLYIAYQCRDRNLIARGDETKQGPPDNRREGVSVYATGGKQDRMQFFVLFDSTRFFWEIHHDAANHFSDAWIMVPDKEWPIYDSSMVGKWKIAAFAKEFIRDQKEMDIRTGKTVNCTLATAVHLQANSTVNKDADTPDHGYTAEIRLPWLGIGAPLNRRKGLTWDMAGQGMRILAVSENGDLANHYHCTSDKLQPGWLHTNAPRFPGYELTPAENNRDE